MPLVWTGRNLIGKQLLGQQTSSQDFNSSNATLVVGDSTETFTASQLDVGSTGANRSYKAMDATYPTYSVTSSGAPVLTFRATFTTSEANHAWNEWLIKNTSATSSGDGKDALNRKQEALGTKADTQSWQFTAQASVTT